MKGARPEDTLSRPLAASSYTAVVRLLMDWLQERTRREPLAAVGHRVVQGGPKYGEPQRISVDLIDEMRRLSPFDPEHLPAEILLTEAFHRRFAALPQVACFDTAFHHDLPSVARLLPIPRHYKRRAFGGMDFTDYRTRFLWKSWPALPERRPLKAG